MIGSGTTMAAAEQLGRIGYGIEIDPRFASVTLERMAEMGLEPVRVGTGEKEAA
jgi:DNA modification methylase